MPVPLYQAKAEFFRMLGHPVRIRVLELLQTGPLPVRDLLASIEVEPSALSQQLAVLRRSGIVTATRGCRVTAVDATGALAPKDAVHRLNGRGVVVLASGIRPGQRRTLESVGALELLRREGCEYATASEAFGGARDRLVAAGVVLPRGEREAPAPVPAEEPVR